MRRTLIAVFAAGLCAFVLDAAAQGYPARPVKIVVGFAAGGPTDVIARILAQDMSVSLGQSVIVENRPGANAIIATPRAIVERLSEEMRRSLARPQTAERMHQQGAVIIGDTPAEFAAFLKKDYERWARVIQAAHVTLQ